MIQPYVRRTSSPTELHRAWLELVDRDGPFIAVPALKRVWPQGIASLSDDAKAALRDAKPDMDRAWDLWSAAVGTGNAEQALADYRGARDKYVSAVLGDVAGWGTHLTWDFDTLPDGVPHAFSPDRATEVHATGAFVRGGSTGALVLVVDPVSSLRDPYDDAWSASPIDRMDALLRASGHPVGVVTDGRWWGIVHAAEGVMTASGISDAQTWIEEAAVRDAFFALIEPKRLVGGVEGDRLPALFRESVTAAEEITVALGTQVRRAVELLVTAFSEAAVDARASGRPDPLPANRGQVYDGAVTVMMRAVFLLFAEERSMMPQTPLFAEAYGIADQLDVLEARFNDENAEALDATHHTWHRLLATSRALYEGVNTEDMRLPAYGGSLFDAARFGFLTSVSDDGSLAVAVSDRVMLEVLRAIQYATVSGERRRISFRDIDVEQIGYIYEGLLGYTAVDASSLTVGLPGAEGAEPEVELDLLDDLYEETGDDAKFVAAVLKWLKDNQPAAKPKSATALKKALVNEPEDAERALLAVTRDEELLARLRPYVGIIRRDLRDRPVVIPPGGLVVMETPSRANSGAHYTPKSLAQEVVLHALEPLVYQPGPHQTADRSQWKLIRWNKILDLKVADIACGSGAFLVAAAEYLAGKLVEAWHNDGIATGSPHDVEVRARRQVVANCLYGADINGMAVEMCKLSLWLVSLDPHQPFSFVDDKVLHGNSLLGITDPKQLEALHIDPSRAQKSIEGVSAFSSGTLFGEGSEATGIEMLDVRGILRDAAELRRDLANPIDESDPARSAKTKRRLWSQYQELIAGLSKVADGVIATGLKHGGKPGKKLDEAYDTLRIAVDKAFVPDADHVDPTMLDGLIQTGLTPEVDTDHERWKPLHWALAVPDVLGSEYGGKGGFDAVIGNPPFLGGTKISGAMGRNVLGWIGNQIAEANSGGRADFVTYFFLRAHSLLSCRGTLGLIATNSVAQGDSREVGLDHMVGSGFTIVRAIQSRPWPAESANLEFAAVWGTVGVVSDVAPRYSDDVAVQSVSTLLEPAGRIAGSPVRLRENLGIAFEGCKPLGMGFVIEEREAERWISEDPVNAQVVFPYVTGEDVNSRPDCTASRWVIDFNERNESDAASYPAPFARVRDTVKPERQRINHDGEFVLRKPLPQRWWQYADRRPALRNAIAGLAEVLVIARVSKAVMPVRVHTGQVFSDRLGVFATDSYVDQAVLSSSIHFVWVATYSSTLETRVNYTASDAFVTFPRPASPSAQGEVIETPSSSPVKTLSSLNTRVGADVRTQLEAAGRALDVERREIMLRRGLGLTKLYNLVSDPGFGDGDSLQSDTTSLEHDIGRMRRIHVELDVAVLAAYGWDDVPLDHGFHTYRQMTRWTVSSAARVELLDRLLEENHRRAEVESAAK